jgi:hypothetical protein
MKYEDMHVIACLPNIMYWTNDIMLLVNSALELGHVYVGNEGEIWNILT